MRRTRPNPAARSMRVERRAAPADLELLHAARDVHLHGSGSPLSSRSHTVCLPSASRGPSIVEFGAIVRRPARGRLRILAEHDGHHVGCTAVDRERLALAMMLLVAGARAFADRQRPQAAPTTPRGSSDRRRRARGPRARASPARICCRKRPPRRATGRRRGRDQIGRVETSAKSTRGYFVDENAGLTRRDRDVGAARGGAGDELGERARRAAR